ncbi:Flagellum site-determining protein YlxH [Lentibacillus sp. JNUCC-1]|uniref:MinD/ParA family protein n=1 Tax=Lentibacillus sp. JNUCC-1 TaxID=2654513 RepID=UPI0012E8A55E|nr:MinD/ParA family protein [Lentibacillus sp. JNUCC-1]MUV39942.1 Flagellum site-determining protein YlxH [Lentibacillus sp. JNUCC-1]
MHDQAERLRQMIQGSTLNKQCRTIAVASGKGGVGKSNISLNLALALIKQHQKVLLFDMDIGMGNIDVLSGLDAPYSIVDLFEKHLSIQEIISEGPEGLAYIAGGSGLNELFTMNDEERMLFFREYTTLLESFDYIIMDMGAGASSESLLFILAADASIIVTTPEPTAITDAYSMIKHMVVHGFNKQLYGIMNRTWNDKQGEKSLNEFQSVVQQFLHINLMALGTVPEDKAVARAVMKQIPLLLMNEKSPAAKAITLMAKRMTGPPDTHQSKSFVDRLKQLMKERSLL